MGKERKGTKPSSNMNPIDDIKSEYESNTEGENKQESENALEGETTPERKKQFDFERMAYIAFVLVVVVCILTMIFCLVSLLYNSHVSMSEYKSTLETIKATAEQATNDPATHSDNSITVPTDSNVSSNEELIGKLVTHMESMIAIQKSGMTNDLMSFVYGMLSTILVGACAGFVIKSRNNADEAQKIVEIANKAAQQAAGNTERACKAAETAESSAQQAEENANKINDLNDKMQAALDDFNISSKNQLIMLQNCFKIFGIYSNAASAKLALKQLDQIDANKRIYSIKKDVDTMFCSNGSVDVNMYDIHSILFLLADLDQLKKEVASFIDKSKKKYGSSNKKEEKDTLASLQQSAENYNQWIDETITACERITKPNT